MLKMRSYGFGLAALCCTAVLFLACSRDSARISGRFVGFDNSKLYLERILPSGQVVSDSTTTDENGYFSMHVKLPQGQTTIYSLGCEGEFIPLLVAPREKIELYGVGSIPNYTVEGSGESERLRELRRLLSAGTTALDSILTLYGSADDDMRRELGVEYAKQYYKTKREHIAFIASHPGKLSSLYALYQRLPGDTYLYNGDNDIIYYRLVADSVGAHYPDSPYLKALRREVADAESGYELEALLREKLSADRKGFPDVVMADMYQKVHRLSDLEGEVILLDFWSAEYAQNRMINAELKEIYSRWSDRGFEIYQVSVDTDKALWVTSVQNQQLPWISVCDFRGQMGLAVMTYNVKSFPSNFLIDRSGNIVARNLYGKELEAKLKELSRTATTGDQ